MDSTAPKLLYGTAWKKNKTKDLVLLALRHGFTGVDTACQPRHYNEKGVGEALATLSPSEKNKIFIQTKFTPLGGQDLD
jgi:diketogulonate reductase-like aldo/keto reductase